MLEDGKPQTIERAEFEQLDRRHRRREARGPVERSETPPSRRARAAPARAQALAQLERDRRLSTTVASSCLFFDLSSMQPEEITRASFRGADLRVAAHAVGPRRRRVALDDVAGPQDFTADRESLDRVIGQLDPNGGPGLRGRLDRRRRRCTADNGAAFTPDETEVNIFNTDRRLEALRALADALGGIDERKSVV